MVHAKDTKSSWETLVQKSEYQLSWPQFPSRAENIIFSCEKSCGIFFIFSRFQYIIDWYYFYIDGFFINHIWMQYILCINNSKFILKRKNLKNSVQDYFPDESFALISYFSCMKSKPNENIMIDGQSFTVFKHSEMALSLKNFTKDLYRDTPTPPSRRGLTNPSRVCPRRRSPWIIHVGQTEWSVRVTENKCYECTCYFV